MAFALFFRMHSRKLGFVGFLSKESDFLKKSWRTVSRAPTYRLLRTVCKRREAQKVYDIKVSCEPAALFGFCIVF